MGRTILMMLIAMALATACQGGRGQAPLVTPAAPAARTESPAAAAPAQTGTAALPVGKAALIALGNDRMDAGRYADAIVAYQKALELDPGNVDVRVDMGTCYRELGQPERAMQEYRKGIEINPRHPNAHRNSGVVLANDLKRPAEAVAEFIKYLEILPNAQDAAMILSEIQRLKASK
jgi:tetratricopeptide (TPR) repeat protein